MINRDQLYPYKLLGEQLKRLRERNLQSLDEVSGAVEIESTQLLDYENGIKRPTEDILLLLISHFAAKESEATELWHMAGYSQTDTPVIELTADESSLIKPIIMMMPMDNRVVYSDTITVKVNKFGVVMNFMQTSGFNGQPQAIARIGMSKEHAKNVLEVLSRSLNQTEQSNVPKALPDRTMKSKPKDQDKLN